MIITPHMLVGAAVGSGASGIGAAFGFGVLSHYLLDVLPHWEYLDSLKITKLRYSLKILLDFLVGLILVLVLVWDLPQKELIIAGVAGALLPDCVQFAYENLFQNKVLRFLHKFHYRVHIWKEISFWKGLPAALIISLAAVWVLIGG